MEYNINDIVIEKVNDIFNFYIIIKRTKYFYMAHKLKKQEKIILDDNERLYREVNIVYYPDLYNIAYQLLEIDGFKKYKRFSLKNIHKYNLELYNFNNKYIENI